MEFKSGFHEGGYSPDAGWMASLLLGGQLPEPLLHGALSSVPKPRWKGGTRAWKGTVRKVGSRISRNSGSRFKFQDGEEERQMCQRGNIWKET